MTMTMNALDFLIIGGVAFSTVISLFRGFTKEALSLVVWGLAFWLALKNANTVGQMFSTIGTPVIRQALGGLIVFLGVLIAGGIVNYLISRFVKLAGFGFLDRIAGVGFGLLRGLVVVTFVIMLLQPSTLSQEPWWQESTLIPKFRIFSDQMAEYIPEEWIKDLTS